MTKSFTHSLNSLIAILKGISAELTIGDLKDAANQFTIPFNTLQSIMEGKGNDETVYTKLIQFFYRRLEIRNEQH